MRWNGRLQLEKIRRQEEELEKRELMVYKVEYKRIPIIFYSIKMKIEKAKTLNEQLMQKKWENMERLKYL